MRSSTCRRTRYLVALACVVAARVVYAQCGSGTREATTAINNAPYDSTLTFARLSFTSGAGGYYYYQLPAWAHGYPTAERSLMKIMEGITGILKTRVDRTNVIAIGDPEMFKYPVSYLAEAGYLTLTDAQARALREYLMKGGFIIFDDFRNRGHDGWGNFVRIMRRVMPEGRIVELTASHPVFHSFFEIPSPKAFLSCYDREGEAEFWGMYEDNDTSKRLLFVANFNNDIAQYWEWSDTGLTPIELSNDAYKFGVNYMMYGLTH